MGLYIIGNISKEICKIGISDTPEKRLKSIQTGCPYKVNILSYYPDLDYKTEKDLHRRFRESRLRGEWFRINDEIRKLIEDKPFTDSPKGINPAKKIKTIPPISYEEQRRLSQPKKRRKRKSGYVKNIYNHR